MKFAILLACFALFVACSEAQRSCRGRVPSIRRTCVGPRDSGFGGRDCRASANRNMWYYDTRTRTCRRMRYRGCGGNYNRYCTRSSCENRCRRTDESSSTAPSPTPASTPETPDPAPAPAAK